MIKLIKRVILRVLFGKIFSEGYVNEPSEKHSYELAPLFPNEDAKRQVTEIIKNRALIS